MEIDEAKARVVQAVVGTGLFPTSQIYKEFYNLTPTEITIIKKELEEEQDAAAEKENQQMAAQAQAQGQGEAEQIEAQGESDMAQSQNQASMDMAVSDNQAKNDMAVNKPKPKPSQKKESIEDFSYLRKKFLIEEGESSEKYKIIDRIIKNKNK